MDCSLIVETTYLPRFLLNTCKKCSTNYGRTVSLRLHKYQDNSRAAPCCQQQKPKMPHKYSLHHKSMKLITQNISLPFFFSEASFSLSDALNLCKSFIKVQYIPLFHQIYPGLCHSLKAPTPVCEYKSHFNT